MLLVDATSSLLRSPRAVESADSRVREQVRLVLGDLWRPFQRIERRTDPRFPFPRLITLFPLDREGREAIEPPRVVVGKHLSLGGLGFFHQHPLPNRLVAVELEKSTQPAITLLLDLTWCRFTEQGWYESGGRFLRVVDSQMLQSKQAG